MPIYLCPGCGQEIHVPEGVKTFVCMGCGSSCALMTFKFTGTVVPFKPVMCCKLEGIDIEDGEMQMRTREEMAHGGKRGIGFRVYVQKLIRPALRLLGIHKGEGN